MITAIILVALIVLGVFLMRKYGDAYDSWGLEVWGFLMAIISFAILIVHIIGVSTVKYDYNKLVHERETIQSTLNNSRLNGNDFENATITQKVMEWNVRLNILKYDNTTLLFDQYVDDRIETIEPIK